MSDINDFSNLEGYSPELSALRGAKQKVYFSAKKRKMELLDFVFRKRLKGNLIIFRKTQFGAEKIMKMLVKKEFPAVCIHSEKPASEKSDALKRFNNNSATILVITDKAFKNLTLKKVDNMINFDVPEFTEDFVNRFAVLKLKAAVHTFCAVDEKPILRKIEEKIDKRFLVEKHHPFNDDLEEFTSEVRRPKGATAKSRKSAASKKKKKRWY